MARRVAADSVTLAEVGVGFGVLSAFGQRLQWATASRVMLTTHVATMLAIANGARHAASLATIPRPVTRDETPWHALDPEDALARLDTGPDGLSVEEALRRRETPEQAASLSQRLWDAVSEELANPLTPILAAGAGLSAAVGALTDAALIGTVMLADAAIGAIERLRAEDAIADLRADRPRTVQVVRDGAVVSIPATDLVRGDVVRLEAGNLVPADCRILEAVGLEADESALTGESLPVVKHAAPIDAEEIAERGSILYEGTAIAAGSATAVVFAVGGATESQRAGAGAAARTTTTGVEARLTSLVELSGPVAIGSGLITAAANLARGRPMSEVVSTAVSLAVAAVPEGLPMLATAAQLAAARRLATRGVLVRNARAIEALGRRPGGVPRQDRNAHGRSHRARLRVGRHARSAARRPRRHGPRHPARRPPARRRSRRPASGRPTAPTARCSTARGGSDSTAGRAATAGNPSPSCRSRRSAATTPCSARRSAASAWP